MKTKVNSQNIDALKDVKVVPVKQKKFFQKLMEKREMKARHKSINSTKFFPQKTAQEKRYIALKKRGIKTKKPKKPLKTRVVHWGIAIFIILLLILCYQYGMTKWQMSKYQLPYYADFNQYREYACVQMSYDAEKSWEGMGFHVVERRVENEHRWIAVEMLPGRYVDYESTMATLGFHLVTDSMIGQKIYQSEGFFSGNTEIVHATSSLDMHTALNDWKEIGMENGPANIGWFGWMK